MTLAQARLALLTSDPKLAIAEFEQILASNSGEDPFDSAIKLLAAKLIDETETHDGLNSKFQIQSSAASTHRLVQGLYRRAIQRWPLLNGNGDDLGISPEHLLRAMQPLIGWQIIGSDLSFLDAALERLVAKNSKGALGQYLTPREVIRFCVQALNPNAKDRIIDPACGSGGFLFEAIQHSIRQHGAGPKCLGIDFGAKAIKVAALLSAATSDAELLVTKANSLDGRAHERASPDEWTAFLSKQTGAPNKRAQSWGDWNKLSCTVLLTNPPFAGDIDDVEMLEAYEAQKDASAKRAISREHLFLERAIHLLMPGGRLAIVLPQGLLANSSVSYLRKWLYGQCRILGVVSLHSFAFLPYTSVKTAVLFLSKPAANESLPKDYSVFFAASNAPGKDSSGRSAGENDYESIGKLFTNFLVAEGFAWAGVKTKLVKHGIQFETVKFSEIFKTDRLDAEFYDPTARAILRRIDTTSAKRLGSLVDSKIDRFKKGPPRDINYLDISSVDSKTGLTFPNPMASEDAPSRASYVVRAGDVLVSTVRPDRNVVALVTEGTDKTAIASNGFCVLRSNAVSPEVLFAYCKTDAFKKMLSKSATASMYPTVTDKDVMGVPYLEPPPQVSDRVTHLVKTSLDMIEKAHRQIGEAIALMNNHVQGDPINGTGPALYSVKEERKPYRRTRRNG